MVWLTNERLVACLVLSMVLLGVGIVIRFGDFVYYEWVDTETIINLYSRNVSMSGMVWE